MVITPRAIKFLPLCVIVLEITDNIFTLFDCQHTSHTDLLVTVPFIMYLK